MNLLPFVKECEDLIRAGEIVKVQALLSGLNSARVPRPLRLRIANLCRRTDMLDLGIKILSPVARPSHGHWTSDASPQELAEYAVLLQKFGAVREAQWILAQIDGSQAPEVYLYRAYCHFNRWEYDEAEPCLRNYCRLETRPYPRLVGQVNLAAATVALQKWDESIDLLDNCLKEANLSKSSRLQSNCLELRAQVHFYAGRWQEAKADLQAAADMALGNSGLDQILIRKWQAVFAAFESKNAGPLLQFREQAVAMQQWESVREADRFILKIDFTPERYDHLRFGTPFSLYRRQLEREYPAAEMKNYIMMGTTDDLVFDFSQGQIIGRRPVEHLSRKSYELLSILIRDFYKPFPVSGLFSDLFPGEYYDLNSSPGRVRQIVYRTRRWARENNVGLEIEEDNGRFRLKIAHGLGALISLAESTPSSDALRLSRLRQTFGERRFSRRDICDQLGLSPSSAKMLMSWALTNGFVHRIGSGRASAYLLRTAK